MARRNPSSSALLDRISVFVVLTSSLFAVFTFQLVYFACVSSATLDEPTHILAGYRHLKCGDFGINPEHPPMLKMLAAVPLLFREMVDVPWECGSKITTKPDSFLYGAKFIVQNDPDSTVVPARLFSTLASVVLAILVFAVAWKMFGRWEAIVALALLAFEPNLIANGAIVTTDMTISAAAVGAVFALYSFCRKPSILRFLVTGLALGLLLAAKHSAVIFVPVLLVLSVADALIYRVGDLRFAKRTIHQVGIFAAVLLLALVVLWSFYGFRYRAIPSVTADPVTVADYISANGRPEMVTSYSARIVEELDRAHIFPESYILGLADIVATGSRNMYLFDTAYPTGQWFYFPISFLIKSSLPLLILLPFGFAFALTEREKRREMMFLLIPSLFFFAVALTSGINIGVRHILPVYPFFIIAASAGAVWMIRKFRAFRFVLLALLGFHAVTAVRTIPDYIPFVNDLWGGPDNAYRIFKDPNLDFGQNTKFVLDYLKKEDITDCWYASHGNIELTASTQPCHLLPGTFQLSLTDELFAPVPPVIDGKVLLSAMAFPPRVELYRSITQTEPIARIGRAVFVYEGRFEIPLAAAISHADRSAVLVRLKRFDEAIVDGQKAVELGPGDPRTHLALGTALARVGRKDEAKASFRRAIEVSRSNVIFRNQEIRASQEIERLENN